MLWAFNVCQFITKKLMLVPESLVNHLPTYYLYTTELGYPPLLDLGNQNQMDDVFSSIQQTPRKCRYLCNIYMYVSTFLVLDNFPLI